MGEAEEGSEEEKKEYNNTFSHSNWNIRSIYIAFQIKAVLLGIIKISRPRSKTLPFSLHRRDHVVLHRLEETDTRRCADTLGNGR